MELINTNIFTYRDVKNYLVGNYFSTETEFVPIISLWNNYTIYNRKIVNFGIPFSGIYSVSSYSQLLECFKRYQHPLFFYTRSMDFRLIVNKGLILDEEENILVAVCVKTKDMVKFIKETEELPPSSFKVFVSNELVLNPKYKTVFRKINELILNKIRQDDVEIIFTNNVKEKCCKSPKDNGLPVFNSLDEHIEYMKSFYKVLVEDG